MSLPNPNIYVASSQKPKNPHQFKIQNSRFKNGHISSSSSSIVEAQGWVLDKNGEVNLVAQLPTANPYSSWQKTASCQL